MKKLTPIEMEKKKLAMRVRAILRLKANEQYAEELNEFLPEAEAKLEKQIQDGKTIQQIDILKALGE